MILKKYYYTLVVEYENSNRRNKMFIKKMKGFAGAIAAIVASGFLALSPVAGFITDNVAHASSVTVEVEGDGSEQSVTFLIQFSGAIEEATITSPAGTEYKKDSDGVVYGESADTGDGYGSIALYKIKTKETGSFSLTSDSLWGAKAYTGKEADAFLSDDGAVGIARTTPDTTTISTEAGADENVSNSQYWLVNESPTNSLSFNIAAGSTVKLEVFYTAGSIMPSITFTDAGGNEYKAGSNFETMFITRSGLSVDGYPGVQYMVIYINQPTYPGTWNCDIIVDPDETTEFAMVSANVDANWATLATEYKTRYEALLLLGYNSERSLYNNDSTFLSYVNEIIEAEEAPTTMEVAPEKVEEEPDYTGLYIAFAIFVIAAIVVITVKTVKKNNLAEEERRKALTEKLNEKYLAKKAKENRVLDKMLRSHNDEYSDDEVDASLLYIRPDEDMESFLKGEEDTDDEEAAVEEKKMPKWMEAKEAADEKVEAAEDDLEEKDFDIEAAYDEEDETAEYEEFFDPEFEDDGNDTGIKENADTADAEEFEDIEEIEDIEEFEDIEELEDFEEIEDLEDPDTEEPGSGEPEEQENNVQKYNSVSVQHISKEKKELEESFESLAETRLPAWASNSKVEIKKGGAFI